MRCAAPPCRGERRDPYLGGNVTSAGWQVTLCDPMWHVSSRTGVETLRTAIHLLLTYLLTYLPHSPLLQNPGGATAGGSTAAAAESSAESRPPHRASSATAIDAPQEPDTDDIAVGRPAGAIAARPCWLGPGRPHGVYYFPEAS